MLFSLSLYSEIDLDENSPIRIRVRKPLPVYRITAHCRSPSSSGGSEEDALRGLYHASTTDHEQNPQLPQSQSNHQRQERWICSYTSVTEEEEWRIQFLTREDFRLLLNRHSLHDDDEEEDIVTTHSTSNTVTVSNTTNSCYYNQQRIGGGSCNETVRVHESTVATRPLNANDSNYNWVPFAAVECHGPVEPYSFNVVDSNFVVKSKGGNVFKPINLEYGGNWSEYDESTSETVIVAELEGKWEIYDNNV